MKTTEISAPRKIMTRSSVYLTYELDLNIINKKQLS